MKAARGTTLARNDERVILHVDMDAFYASVFENENPALRSLPLAVQQKQIIVTCNYEARRRGLHKLQLISEAKRVCPDVVIVLGEQLDRFRDASKDLYKYIEGFTWNKKVERLGLDEVFLDVSDVIDFNQDLLNTNNLRHAFFHLSRNDPTLGFPFDATTVAGHQYPEVPTNLPLSETEYPDLLVRLRLGSHMAQYIRRKLVEEKGYTSTVGISTSKLLSKLVGNLHKPNSQTTLMPPYESVPPVDDAASIPDAVLLSGEAETSNVTKFIDAHDLGSIPYIGFKMSQKIRSHILSRPAQFEEGLIYGATRESISVGFARRYPGMGPELLEKLLGGPGSERGLASKTWALMNGVDESEVNRIKKVPSQISIEDSYIRLDTMAQVYKELRMICTTLLRRMRVDLLEDDVEDTDIQQEDSSHAVDPAPVSFVTPVTSKRWTAHPKTIRLTTRPRPPANPDGTRSRSFKRISRSGPLPNFVFSLHEGLDVLVEKLVQETLVPMFHKLHPERQGWNLSIINVAVTNMIETATDNGPGDGRDIGRMFKRQEQVLKEWKVEDRDVPPNSPKDGKLEIATDYESSPEVQAEPSAGNEAMKTTVEHNQHSLSDSMDEGDVQWEDEDNEVFNRCQSCGAGIPAFAMAAHQLYHDLGD